MLEARIVEARTHGPGFDGAESVIRRKILAS
jgi:hypothetical protein